MLKLAGELTDGTVTACAGLDAVEQQIVPGITNAAESAGRRRPEVIVGLPVSVTADAEAARAQIAQAFGLAGETPAYRAMLELDGAQNPADICVVGDEAEVVEQLQRFADVGATEFSALPFGDPATTARTVEVLANA